MFVIIGIMFAGVGLGYLLRNVETVQYVGKTIGWTIFALLFVLGISVGSNDTVMSNLSTLGAQALVLAVTGAAGSAFAAWLVWNFAFRTKEKEEER